MEKITIEFWAKEHPEIGPIGTRLGNMVLQSVYAVYSQDITRGLFKVENYDTYPGNTEDLPKE